jgi:MFS family permease
MEALLDLNWMYLLLAAFAGGAFGAAVGALPAFVFTGIMVIAGEAGGLNGVTGSLAFGAFFGPHVSFAGGAAAAAYAAKKGYMQTGFDFHESKNITAALGLHVDVLVVGGLFGILGVLIRQVSVSFGMPWDPIAMGVVLSALFHRLFLGYSLIGKVHGAGLFDMGPFEREEKRVSDAGTVSDHIKSATDRLAVEPWLPHQYKWGNVAFLGLTAGLLGAYAAIETGSPFLAFGISAASLLFLNLGVEKFPVTHHMTLPASTIALAVVASGEGVEAGLITGASDLTGLIAGAVFGLIGALFGEAFQRVFYSHGDTHWDPPAAAIVFATFLIALLYLGGVLGTTVWVPTP